LKTLRNSKLSTKSQITVPKYVRDILALKSGDLVVFVIDEKQVVLKKGEVQVNE
jgi:AbrB family looped-hinge helix DNA binding protein